MTRTALFAAGDGDFAEYEAPLHAAFARAGLDVAVVTEAAPDTVDYIIYAPANPLQDFTPFTRCRAVLSLWAGVERIVGNPTLTQPLARMVDPSLTQGMVEYVTGHVLRYHLGLDRPATAWDPVVPPLAQDRRVGFLGLGELGRACAQALAGLGFQVAGWSRSARDVAGIAYHHGAEGLRDVLRSSDILVTLLPDTPATANILNADTLAQLPRGARIVNPGRGTLIEDAALLAALDSGQIAAATLDVFRTEPLPADHPYWVHPRVTVTPHIAAATRPDTASEVIAQNIARVEAGLPLLHEVSRGAGY
ncbi:MAG: glyoxylate/hydroxypyruvate reductase A [Rhodobacteraceae bacterium]|nr:glyoxylate/hydroxypyruvate reductase A [Paracoccaceae bacterium]